MDINIKNADYFSSSINIYKYPASRTSPPHPLPRQAGPFPRGVFLSVRKVLRRPYFLVLAPWDLYMSSLARPGPGGFNTLKK